MLRVLISFIWTKFWFIKLPIAPEFKSALMECILLVFVVLIAIGRIINIPWVLRVLAESRLGNLFSHFGLRSWATLSRVEEEREGASIGSQISVLTFSTSNTANLLTSGDRGTLFAGHAKQNPPLGLSKLPLPLLHPSGPLSLQSIPPSALWLTSGCLSSGGSPSQDGWPLHTNSTHAEVKSTFSRLCLCPWVLLQMV